MHPLVANGGELTVLRSLAAFSYGSWNVSWPESVPEDQRPVLPDDRDFGYAARLKDEPGRMGRRFVRANTTISAAEYKEDGSRVEFTGSSDVEQVLDAAAKRTDGEAFIEREFDRSGLGRLVPRLDFSEGDIVPVLIWGKLFSGPVESITDVVAAGQVVGWSVHVGGELVTDDLARRRSNRDLQASIAQERRERLKDLGAVDSKASAAQSSADAAQGTADSVRTDFDELAKRVERDARVVADSISRTVSQADFEAYDGKLQSRLWGEQGEFNRITADSLSKQEQINAQQKLIDAQQDEIADALKKQVALSTALSAANAKAIEVQKEAERKRPRPVFATYSSYNPRYVDPEGYLRIEPYSTGDRGFRLTCLGDWTGTMVVRATAIGPLSANSIDSVRCRVTSSSRIFNGTPEALQMSYNTLDVTIYPD